MQILNYLSNTLKKIHLKNLSIRVKLDFSAKKRLRAIALVKYRIQPLTASRRTNPIFSPGSSFIFAPITVMSGVCEHANDSGCAV